jgi:hypothetical protein
MPAVGRWRMAAAITLVAGLTSWASALADGSPPPAPSASGLPRLSVKAATHPRRVLAARPSHLIVVVEENHAFEQIIGSPAAPFLNHLAAHGTLLTHYYAITHPSLPNYVALLSGRDPIRSDCRTCTFPGPTLVDQLEARHISWAAYLQGLPRPCSSVASFGAYTEGGSVHARRRRAPPPVPL